MLAGEATLKLAVKGTIKKREKHLFLDDYILVECSLKINASFMIEGLNRNIPHSHISAVTIKTAKIIQLIINSGLFKQK